jgi:hypothetical protein
MARHIIHRQQVTLNLPRREEAHAFQNRVSDLLRNELTASTEAVLDELFPTTNIVRIDSLLLDLGNVDPQNFEQEFKAHFIEELKKSLSSKKDELIDENNEKVLSPQQSQIKAFIYFLENGYLPWYSAVEDMISWADEISKALSQKKDQYFLTWLHYNYTTNPVVLQRLVLQFDNGFLENLLSVIAPLANESWEHIYHDLEALIGNLIKKSSSVRDKVWQHVFEAVLNYAFLEGHIVQSEERSREQILHVLNLSAEHFNISGRNITLLLKNKLNRALKTSIVKEAFEKLHSHLTSQIHFEEQMDEPLVVNKNEEAGINNAPDDSEEITERKKKRTEEAKSQNTNATINSTEQRLSKDKTNNSDTLINASKDKTNNNDPLINAGKDKAGNNDTLINAGQDKAGNNDELINDNASLSGSGDNDIKNIPADISKDTGRGQEAPLTEDTTNTNKRAFLNPVANEQVQKDALEKAVSEKKENVNKQKQSPFQTKKITGITEQESLYIKSSGIVILHYFLTPYFTDLGLLTDKKFTDDEAHQRAVLLLYYLTTGHPDAAEFDLTLHKILCGYPLEQTLPVSIILTKKEKTESKRLLEAIIDHWSPLKNTSIKGLRDTFFERDGKLTKKENGWLLTVEQRTIDVLLGKLPWGYSTIRLPWMQEILNVDWY